MGRGRAGANKERGGLLLLSRRSWKEDRQAALYAVACIDFHYQEIVGIWELGVSPVRLRMECESEEFEQKILFLCSTSTVIGET